MDIKTAKFVKQRVFFTFFGSNSLPRGIVVTTPIDKIFKNIKKTFPLIETTKGWWKRALVKIGSSLVTILKISSGSNYIQDCLEVLNNLQIKGVIFLGYCASFSKKIKVGQIVIPTQAVFGKRRINLPESEVSSILENERLKVALVRQLLLPKRKVEMMRAQLGDMETFFLYKFSQNKKIPVLALLLVTDRPLFYPFYCLSRTDKAKLNSSIKRLMRLLKRYVYKFQKMK